MSGALSTFNSCEDDIRVIGSGGELWFLAKDVAQVLASPTPATPIGSSKRMEPKGDGHQCGRRSPETLICLIPDLQYSLFPVGSVTFGLSTAPYP